MEGGMRLAQTMQTLFSMTTQRLPKINCLLEAESEIKLSQIISAALGIFKSRFSRNSLADVAQIDTGFTL